MQIYYNVTRNYDTFTLPNGHKITKGSAIDVLKR